MQWVSGGGVGREAEELGSRSCVGEQIETGRRRWARRGGREGSCQMDEQGGSRPVLQ